MKLLSPFGYDRQMRRIAFIALALLNESQCVAEGQDLLQLLIQTISCCWRGLEFYQSPLHVTLTLKTSNYYRTT
jgi:hypothetical protein